MTIIIIAYAIFVLTHLELPPQKTTGQSLKIGLVGRNPTTARVYSTL